MRTPQRPKEGGWFWDVIAKRYDKQTHKDENYARAVDRFALYLRADHTVLDYACGTGVISFRIAGLVKQVHAIDTSARMIQLANQRARECRVCNVRFEQKSLLDERLGAGTYDVLLAFNILHLLDDARVAVDRAARLLKPGGLLVSSTPCLGEAGILLRALLPLVSKVILSHLRVFRMDQVRDLIRDGGFQILESKVREDSIPLYFAVARKR